MIKKTIGGACQLHTTAAERETKRIVPSVHYFKHVFIYWGWGVHVHVRSVSSLHSCALLLPSGSWDRTLVGRLGSSAFTC